MRSRITPGTWAALRQVLHVFFAPHPFKLWLGMFMATVTVVCGLVLLGLSGWFITATSIVGMGLWMHPADFNVIVPAACIRFLALARTASRYAERLVTHDGTLTVLADLRERLFRGWAKPQAAQFLLKRPAQLLFRLTVDIDALDSLYLRVLVPAAAAMMVTVLAGLAFGVWISPWLGVALVVWLLAAGIGVPFVMSLRAQRAARLKAYGYEALRARSIDLVAGQVELLMAGQLQQQYQSLLKADVFLCRADNEMNKLEIWVSVMHGLATMIILVGVLLVCALMVQGSVLTAPLAAFALLVLLAIFEPFTALRRGAVEFGRTLLAVKRLAPQLVDDGACGGDGAIKAGNDVALSPDTVLVVRDVCYTYPGKSAPVLKNICLEVQKSQKIAIVGSSGSGKSTLLTLIAQEMFPDHGDIGCTSFSILTQRTELFKDTLRGNLLLADPKANDDLLWAALEDAGLAQTVKGLPQGLDTWLGENGLGLSGGQARRLALARLLLRKAPLWLLDEPTEGLDHKTANDVLSRIASKGEQQAMLIATHLQREAILANSIVVVDKNQVFGPFCCGTSAYNSALGQLKPN